MSESRENNKNISKLNDKKSSPRVRFLFLKGLLIGLCDFVGLSLWHWQPYRRGIERCAICAEWLHMSLTLGVVSVMHVRSGSGVGGIASAIC